MHVQVWALVALAACACARTATRVQPVSAKITSLTDKDNKRKAMEHPAFANAGRTPGVEVWRIEDFEPVPVPTKDFGKFYRGDSYIILKTTSDKRNNLSWDIHYWLGSQTSQDEAGAAAILTVGLDDKFGGAPVQHRETEGHESSQFTGYFQSTIRYLDGGHASGFSHVTTNAGAEKRLFQIKGKRNVRVRQIDPLISSMNKGDCFILDVNHDIYVYVGEKAKNVERLKAISVANQIRDQDHNGRAKVEIIDAYSSESDVQKFFTALGSGSRDIVPEEAAGGDDQTFERSEEQTIILSEISDSSGSLKVTPLTKPYKQEQLKPQECYILDTVSGSIYVWVGKQSTEREKTEAMNKAQQYLTAKKYPSWVHVTRIPQGTEPAAFKQYFSTWRDVGMSHSRIVRSLSDEEYYASDDEVSAARARIIGKTGTARGFMPDNGDGEYTVYRIEDMQLVKVYSRSSKEPATRGGEFYQGDSYVIQYEYNNDGRRGYVIYYWLGKDSTQDEQTSAAINTVLLDNSLNGAAVIVRVPQGEEPKHFLKIFKGRLVTYLGGKASGFKNTNEKDSYDNDGVRLFRIFGTKAGEDMRAEQVPEVASSLNSDDVYVLQKPAPSYLWIGKDSSAEERTEAEIFKAMILKSEAANWVEISEGDEPREFWDVLGGGSSDDVKSGQWRGNLSNRIGTEARLFDADLSADNTVSFDEITNYKQTDLQQDDVYVLDTGDEVYVWVGKEASGRMRKAAQTIGEGYVRSLGRTNGGVIIVVKQGLETDLFIKIFGEWDPEMWQKQKTYEEERDAALRDNEIDLDE